jgi:hypothetical protein
VAAGLAALVATASRPNGFVVVVALVVAWWYQRRQERGPAEVARPLAWLAGPSVAFLAIWCAVCWYLTDDPLVFVTAKQAWHEYTLLDWAGHADATMHVIFGLLLLVPFLVQIRRQPRAWIVLVALSIVPSMFLGVIGLARYAVQCFPLAIAAGDTLERATPKVARLALAGSAVALVVYGLLVTRWSYVP